MATSAKTRWVYLDRCRELTNILRDAYAAINPQNKGSRPTKNFATYEKAKYLAKYLFATDNFCTFYIRDPLHETFVGNIT